MLSDAVCLMYATKGGITFNDIFERIDEELYYKMPPMELQRWNQAVAVFFEEMNRARKNPAAAELKADRQLDEEWEQEKAEAEKAALEWMKAQKAKESKDG